MVQDSILQLHSFALLCVNYLSSLRRLSLIQLIPKCVRTFPLTSASMIASLDGSKVCWYLTWTMQIQHLQFPITVVSSFLLNRVVSQSLIILSFSVWNDALWSLYHHVFLKIRCVVAEPETKLCRIMKRMSLPNCSFSRSSLMFWL